MDLNRQDVGENILVGYFADYSGAEDAIHDLTEAGLSANQIGIATTDGVPESQLTDGASRHESFWSKVVNFFEGKDHSERETDPDFMRLDSSAYDERLRSGGVLVTVNFLSPEERQECEDILEEHGGKIEEGGVSRAAGVSESKTNLHGQNQGSRIQLLSEVLRVHKDRISKGEVRLRKEVVNENQTLEVPVSREELVIERNPAVSGAVPSRDIGSDQEVRVPLSEEQVRVEKKPIVKEEVRVGKKKVQESKRVNEQVKREELRVDNDADAKMIDQPKKGVA
jgi:uncharacterized protein (TIGR02271 family)